MSTVQIIDYEDYITMEEGEVIYVSISDWDIPPGISTDYFTQAGSLIVSTAEATPSELEAPVAANLVLTSNPTLPEKMEWKAQSAGGGTITLTNKSGSDQVAGTVVIFDKTNDQAFTITSILNDRRICGVLEEDIANNASGKVAVKGKIVTVKVQGNVNRGTWLIASATAGRAEQYGTVRPSIGALGIALTEYVGGGAGTVSAVIDSDFYSIYLAIELLGAAATGSATSTTVSATHTLSSGSNRIVFAFVTCPVGQTVSSVTYAGISMTRLGTGVAGVSDRMECYYILEASLPATGAKTVTATISGSAACGIHVWSIKNAKQSVGTPSTSSSSSAVYQSASLSVTVQGTFAITGGFTASGGTMTQDPGQLEVTEAAAAGGTLSTSYEECNAGSNTQGVTASQNRMLFMAFLVEPV